MAKTTNKKSSKKPAKKPVVVNRKFLNTLADDIYNPKTKKFLRLCAGTLQNGPDPKDAKRPMHCGLGELYFAMTGRQPDQDEILESGVADLAVERADFGKMIKSSAAAIEKLSVPERVKEVLRDAVDDLDEYSVAGEFRAALMEIPDVNDWDDRDECDDETKCTDKTYRARAARVAKQLREAAKHLPE